MDITIQPRKLQGQVTAIPSKSQAHRLLICAALADRPTRLRCPDTNRDMEATVSCLNALGANITRQYPDYFVVPIARVPRTAVLPCGESGSTLRFLLPIAGALGVEAVFELEGRLPQRPLSPLWEEMERMGCTLSRPSGTTVRCCGRLRSGRYEIDGGVSSQFITGLLFALSLLPGENRLEVTGSVQSRPYIEMTKQAMALFDAPRYRSPGQVEVEGDWSNGAFFLTANALGSRVEVQNLAPDSPQGDRAVVDFLQKLQSFCVIDAAQTPDLVPVLAVAAGALHGADFVNAGRLRLKETDRLATTSAMINALGGCAQVDGDTLRVKGTGYAGGTVDAANDHRIAMAAGIAATVCTGPVTILHAEAVEKSYPKFWAEYRKLGGHYE